MTGRDSSGNDHDARDFEPLAVSARAQGFDDILEQIADICAAESSIRSGLAAISEPLRLIVPHDRLLVSKVKPVIGSTEIFYQAGFKVEGRPEGWSAPVHESLVQEIVRSKKTWLNSDVDRSTQTRYPSIKPAIEAGVKSWLATPLLINGECVGVMQFQSLNTGAYDRYHVQIVERIAELITARYGDQMSIDKFRSPNSPERDDAGERAIVAELGHLIHSTPDLNEAYGPFARRLKQLLQFDGMQIAIRNSDSGEWKLGYENGPKPVGGIAGKGIESDSTYTSFAIAQSSPIVLTLNDGPDIDVFLERHPTMRKWVDAGLKSALSAPLITRGNSIGVLHIWSKRSSAYSEKHAELIEQIAIYVASAVNNSELSLRQRKQIEQRATIAEIGSVITSSLNYEDGLPEFAQLTRQIVPWDRMLLHLFREGDSTYTVRFVIGDGSLQRTPGDESPLSGSFAEYVAEMNEPVALDASDKFDAHLIHSRFNGLASAVGSGIRSFLAVPLVSGDGLKGTLHLGCFEEAAYSEDHVQALQQISAHLATAIANAQLKARLEKESEQKSIIARLGQILSSDVYLNNVIPDFHNELKKLVSADRFVLATYDAPSHRFEDRYVLGVRIPGWDDLLNRPSSNLPVHKITELKKGWIVPSSEMTSATPENDPGLAASHAVGLKSVMFMPLITGGRITGSLNLKSLEENAYSAKDLELLERVALQVAGSVAAAESFQQAIEAARDRERRVRAESEKAILEEEANERSRFITQVGHELRTPLTTMLAFADILRRNKTNNLEEPQVEKLKVIQRNGRRLAVLIDDMLDLSRIEIGNYELKYSKLDVTSVVADVAEDFHPIVSSKSQNLVMDLPDHPVVVEVDPQRLAQVISTALSNASSYSPENSSIHLALSRHDDGIQISVTDEGDGIDPDSQHKVFELFYRVDNEVTRRVPGTGIGLYVAKTIVEAHGGAIDIENSPGKGLTISIKLPAEASESLVREDSAA